MAGVFVGKVLVSFLPELEVLCFPENVGVSGMCLLNKQCMVSI